jgi:two-component system cell cycle response regulator
VRRWLPLSHLNAFPPATDAKLEMTLVLIVQNSGRSRADMAATLRAEGYDILEAENAEAGTQLAHEAGPQAILLDPKLPNRSGYELYAKLRHDRATNAIPVLFLPTQAGPSGEPVAVGGLDVVTRVGVALRTRAMLETLRRAGGDISIASLTDALTGLPNRHALERLTKLHLSGAREEGRPLAVVLVDLDSFARVNERWGFAVGDHALQAFAGLLHSSVRTADTIGRWGGASYLLLLPDTRLDAAWHVAERVRQGIEVLGAAFAGMVGAGPTVLETREVSREPSEQDEPEIEVELDVEVEAEGEPGPGGETGAPPGAPQGAPEAEASMLSASIGVAERYPDDEWEDLLRRAGTALARAKRAGRNRTAVA